MTHEEYKQQLAAWAGLTEKRLAALCDEYLPQQSELGQAARYSLLGGGKRVRAVLTLAACQLAGADAADALDYACALEMLHCYSLIHDDMPCMDNDDFRRGRPSCHKQFGEATALLAADALVTAAFEVLAHAKCSAESRIEAVQLLAKGGGDRGMLYGQELDKHFETVRAGEAELFKPARPQNRCAHHCRRRAGLCRRGCAPRHGHPQGAGALRCRAWPGFPDRR